MALAYRFLLATAAFAQSAQPPSFEAAQIRLNTSGSEESSELFADGRVTLRNASVRLVLAEAWTVTPDDVYGPSWLDDVHVDVVAKASSANTPDSVLRQMLQVLLRDRMKMVGHIEQREQPVWALSVWKGHPKLTPSEVTVKPEDSGCQMAGAERDLVSCVST